MKNGITLSSWVFIQRESILSPFWRYYLWVLWWPIFEKNSKKILNKTKISSINFFLLDFSLEVLEKKSLQFPGIPRRFPMKLFIIIWGSTIKRNFNSQKLIILETMLIGKFWKFSADLHTFQIQLKVFLLILPINRRTII